MKRLLLILFLTLSFQTLTKADDVSDFQIEGMSIGDSLLDFYSENEIKNSIDKLQSDNDYSVTLISLGLLGSFCLKLLGSLNLISEELDSIEFLILFSLE